MFEEIRESFPFSCVNVLHFRLLFLLVSILKENWALHHCPCALRKNIQSVALLRQFDPVNRTFPYFCNISRLQLSGDFNYVSSQIIDRFV